MDLESLGVAGAAVAILYGAARFMGHKRWDAVDSQFTALSDKLDKMGKAVHDEVSGMRKEVRDDVNSLHKRISEVAEKTASLDGKLQAYMTVHKYREEK